MTTATLSTTRRTTTRPRDWYAVAAPAPVRHDPRRTFTSLATRLAAAVPSDRRHLDAALGVLADAAEVGHLAPAATDPDVVVQRLAGRILARFSDRPEHPAVLWAAHRLDA